MKRYLWLTIGVLLVFSLVITGCARKKEKEEAEVKPAKKATPYKIGAVLSLTGTYSGLGVPEKNALELEVKKINEAGGVNGHPIELFIEDDGTDEAKAVAATSKLINERKVIAIIGATGTGQSMAMRDEIDKAKIPQVSLAGGNVITAKFDKWVFQVPWPNGVVVPAVLSYMKKQGIKKFALLYDSGGFGKDGKEVIEKEAPKEGFTIVTTESYNPGDLDMKPQLTKIKATDAQAVVVWGAGKETPIIAKNMKELAMDIPFIGSHGIARKAFIEGAGEAAEDVVHAAGKLILPESYGEGTRGRAIAEEFIDDYAKAYGSPPDGTFPGHAYDGLYIIVEAIKRLGKPPEKLTPAELRDEIERTKNLELLGGIFNYSPTDHVGTKPSDVIMVKIKNGQWTWIK
jgi:branched-chain amino acid transport system substrate-binding protein